VTYLFQHPALHGIITSNHDTPDFKNLGLRGDLCDALKTMNIDLPTPVQVFPTYSKQVATFSFHTQLQLF
jgi:hypothetical protein